MGIILDSSIIIAAERHGESVSKLFHQIISIAGDQEVALSSIGLTELVHAVYRTQDFSVRVCRERFIQELVAEVEVVAFTKATAFLAGRLDGEQRALGLTIPSIDLLIGATALEYGYAVATVNLRHFQLIPGLKVIAF